MGKHSDLLSMVLAAAALAAAVLLSPWTSRALSGLDLVAGTPATAGQAREACTRAETAGCVATQPQGVVTATAGDGF
jgi:hypothetical protein